VEQALVRQILDRAGFELLCWEEATQFALPGGERTEAGMGVAASILLDVEIRSPMRSIDNNRTF
jgi:hypothetical protein